MLQGLDHSHGGGGDNNFGIAPVLMGQSDLPGCSNQSNTGRILVLASTVPLGPLCLIFMGISVNPLPLEKARTRLHMCHFASLTERDTGDPRSTD